MEALGAPARMRLGQSLAAFERDAAGRGLRLVLRSGPAATTVAAVTAEVGAGAVHWTQDDSPLERAQDEALTAALAPLGIAGRAYPGAELAPHGAVLTRSGRPYSVFTPFWRALRARDPGPPAAAPLRLEGWRGTVRSERLPDWRLDSAMSRGAVVTGAFQSPGEGAARARLAEFPDRGLRGYALGRDRPDLPATSGLSEHLAWGEISPRRIWAETFATLDARSALRARSACPNSAGALLPGRRSPIGPTWPTAPFARSGTTFPGRPTGQRQRPGAAPGPARSWSMRGCARCS